MLDPSEGISDEELDVWRVARRWVTDQDRARIIARIDAAEATIAELRDSLDAEREIGSLLNVRDLAAAKQRIADLEGVLEAAKAVYQYMTPESAGIAPDEAELIRALAALSPEEKT